MVYKNIKEIADKKGIPITVLEEKAGLARGTIFKWSDSSPTVANLKKVADLLKVKVDTLLKEQAMTESQIEHAMTLLAKLYMEQMGIKDGKVHVERKKAKDDEEN